MSDNLIVITKHSMCIGVFADVPTAAASLSKQIAMDKGITTNLNADINTEDKTIHIYSSKFGSVEEFFYEEFKLNSAVFKYLI